MQILNSNTTSALMPCMATIGCFDGVHRGHRFLISQVCKEAQKRGLASMLITFPVHPRQVMQQDYQPQLLSCMPHKERLLAQQEADFCLMLPFTVELSHYSAREFMQFLHERYQVQGLVIGYDHRFGHNRSESFIDYCRYGRELGIEVIQAESLTEEGISISSSVIRRLLKDGNIEQANRFLGYNYYMDGTVVGGFKMGRKLGFPTANLQPLCKEKLIPAEGVYAAYALLHGKRYAAMVNIGHRPTLENGSNLSIEAHLLNYSGDLYQQAICLEFISFLRREEKFESLEALIVQLQEDRKMVAKITGVHNASIQ